jgi:hypothetical protein
MWCLDRWYQSRDQAEEKQHWYLVEGAGEAYIVIDAAGTTFGVLYEAPIPFADWHAFGGDPPGLRIQAAEVNVSAVLDRKRLESE